MLCIILRFKDIVQWIRGFKFSYLEYILDEGIIIVEYLFSYVICRLSDVDGRVILRWIFGKLEGVETGWSWLRIGTDGGHL